MEKSINMSDASSESNEQPTGERWDPLGAATDDVESLHLDDPYDSYTPSDPNRLRSLEEEQELLTTSLFALTSHFAQVQFRLKQIVEAPTDERDQLLRNLEEFAFRGIPELADENSPNDADPKLLDVVERQRQRQYDLIDQLKCQLADLEKLAYESGAPVLPQSVLLEKQKVIIDELKNKVNLNVNDMDLPQLTPEDLRNQVDTALGEFVSPLKMKETLVAQLKTQICDLERFVAFLQCETHDLKELASTAYAHKNCKCGGDGSTSAHSNRRKHQFVNNMRKRANNGAAGSTECGNATAKETDSIRDQTSSLIAKASALVQMFALTQFGCGSQRFQRNTLKKTNRGNHWGDLRAQLEVDVQEIITLSQTILMDAADERTTKSEQTPSHTKTIDCLKHVELTTLIRKNFCSTLQKLMQHGLYNDLEQSTSLVPFIGCFMRQQSRYGKSAADDESTLDGRTMHAWELILEYYNIKNGNLYNDTPARKLSDSFNLDIVGNTTISNKQSLLSAIGSIIAIHSPYKRSLNSHFKAFVSAGLNTRKLTQWLHLIFQCTELVNVYYLDWSYVARTGFRDALRTIDRLTKYHFDLPVDLAVRQFQNIKDVFM